jgi:HSP20 family protein
MIRWEPAAELHTIQNEMNRLFNTLFDTSSQTARSGHSAMLRWIPPMDVVETDEDYVLRADLPGLTRADVNIELEDNLLTISGERREEHDKRGEGYYRVERAFGAFSRSLTLPEGIDPEAVQAQFDRGVLEVRVPKPSSESRTRWRSALARGAPWPVPSRAARPPRRVGPTPAIRSPPVRDD